MANIRTIKNKKGKTYKVTIRIKGYKPVYKTFNSYQDAKTFATATEDAMNKGSFSQTEFIDAQGNKINTVTDLILYFQKEVAPSRYADSTKYDVMFAWWKLNIGQVQLKQLTTAQIVQCKNLLKNEDISIGKKITKRQANTINKYLMCMSAILTYAVKELQVIQINPMQNVSLIPKPNGRTRFLSIDEIKTLINTAKETSYIAYIFFLLSIQTGGRYSEVLNLKVENIDTQNSRVLFLDTKNKTHRGVYVESQIIKIILDYINENNITDYIFINKKTNKLYYMRGIMQKIIQNANIKDFRIHDLRHTTASYIAMNGGSLLDIAEILGHKSLTMSRRYSHLTQKHTATVLNTVANKILPLGSI